MGALFYLQRVIMSELLNVNFTGFCVWAELKYIAMQRKDIILWMRFKNVIISAFTGFFE